MIEANEFVDLACREGFTTYTGVPCSFLTPFINYVIGDEALDYISSANEGDAVATAAGAYLGGRRAVAMMQNSGLGNAVSPLTSLNFVFQIPTLLICTHRGAPGVSDEPQHELMGQVSGDLFDTMRIPWADFPQEANAIEGALDTAVATMQDSRRPYAFLMQKGTVANYPLSDRPRASTAKSTQVIGEFTKPTQARISRAQALSCVIENTALEQTVVLATTGFTGRELFALDDRPNHLYMVGSMGCISALALGLALARPDLHVVAVDGDGAGLMRMGNFATVGAYGAKNLTHLLLDNEVHDSTGAQATVAAGVDFANIALACGYSQVMRGDDIDTVADALTLPRRGPTFAHVKIAPGTIEDLPRPNIKPAAVKDRLMNHIGSR